MTDTDVDEKYQKGRRKAFRATYRRLCNRIAKRDFNKKYVDLDNLQQKQVYEKYKKEEPKSQNPVTFENYDEDAKLLELIKKIPSIRKKSTKVPKQVETAEKDRVFVLSENKPKKCKNIPYAKEKEIEDLLEKNIGVLMPDAFIIGRQVMTGHGLWIDLLALDKDGDLVIIELKKAKAKYKVTGQIWHYFTWIKKQSYDEINDIAKKKHLQDYHSIDQKFNDYFKRSPDKWNSHQKLIIVGEKIDEETKEIASTVKESGKNITCVELNAYDNSPEKIVVIRYVPF